MRDIFQGDPMLIMINDGATLSFTGGQPVMDQGLANQAQISLFTAEGWPGNYLFNDSAQKIGSNFEETARGPITLSRLSLVEKSAENALAVDLFGTVKAVASNPESWRTDVKIDIEPPGTDRETILLTKNGQNWISQINNIFNLEIFEPDIIIGNPLELEGGEGILELEGGAGFLELE